MPTQSQLSALARDWLDDADEHDTLGTLDGTATAHALRHCATELRALAAERPESSRPHRFAAPHLRIVVVLAGLEQATHERITHRYATLALRHDWPLLSGSSVRTRMRELERWGIVERAAARGRTRAGRPASAWQILDPGLYETLVSDEVVERADVAPDLQPVVDALVLAIGHDVVERAQLQWVAEAMGLQL